MSTIPPIPPDTPQTVNPVVVKDATDWFWPSIAAMAIAMMMLGYDCSCYGCDCRPPAPVVEMTPPVIR